MNTHIFILHLVKAQHLIKHKLTIYGLPHQHTNVMMDHNKLIGQIIILFTLHSNYVTMFLNYANH
jgi:hypothetical protein